MSRADVVQWWIDFLGAKTYLEIGVGNGDVFLSIKCVKKIGVDIQPVRFGGVYRMSSDEYFLNRASRFDVAFVDGDHSYEQSLRDVENCLEWMNPNGVIILHDCNPTTEEMAAPEIVYGFPDWCGEVWKTILTLRTNPDLYVAVMDEDFGVGIVRKDRQEPLNYSREQISAMTYKDLNENRDLFLGLVKQ